MKKTLIFIYLIFSTAFTPIAAKVAVQQISPLSLAFLRFGLAAILFNIVFHIRKLSYKIDKKDYLIFLLLGALVVPINQFFFLKGVFFSNASHSGVIYSCTPLFVYLLSVKIKHEVFSCKKLLIIFISILGIITIFYDSLIKFNLLDGNLIFGDILLIGAVFSWASYLTFSKNMVIKYGAIKTSSIALTIGIVLYIPIFLADYENLIFEKIDLLGLLSFLHLSVIVAFISYFVFVYSAKSFRISNLTTYLNSSPAVTIFFSWLLLSEPLTALFLVGAFITILGSFLLQYVCKDSNENTLIQVKTTRYEGF